MEIDQPVKEVNMECVCGSLDLVSAEKKKRYVRRVNLRFCESCESVTQIRDSGFVIHDLVHGDNGNFILIRFVNRVGVLMKFGRPNFQIHSRELRMLL